MRELVDLDNEINILYVKLNKIWKDEQQYNQKTEE